MRTRRLRFSLGLMPSLFCVLSMEMGSANPLTDGKASRKAFMEGIVISCGLLVVGGVAGVLLEDKYMPAYRQAYFLCDKNFGDEKDLVEACDTGALTASKYVYKPFESRRTSYSINYPIILPELSQFRQAYLAGQSQCDIKFSDKSKSRLAQRMACYDGYDAFAANLARYSTYDYGAASDIRLYGIYFQYHTYKAVYNDKSLKDQAWLYLLAHHVFEPEYYPGYRRDRIYVISDEGASSEVSVSYNPVLRAAVGPETGTFLPGSTYGPRSNPRPYPEGSPWHMELESPQAQTDAPKMMVHRFIPLLDDAIYTRSGGQIVYGGFAPPSTLTGPPGHRR